MRTLTRVLGWLFDMGEPYDPLDLNSFPPGSKPCYDMTGQGRSSLLPFAVALRERGQRR